MSEIAHYLGGFVSTDPEDEFAPAIQRTNVLSSALYGIDRKAFSPFKALNVCLVHVHMGTTG